MSDISQNQKKLFSLIADFAVDTVVGWVSLVYNKHGYKVAAGDAFAPVIIPFAQRYFNMIAYCIYSREDAMVNEKFDEMASIKLAAKNDPMDILHLVVMLCLNLVNDMDVRDAVSDDYATSMLAVQAHLAALVKRHSGLASELKGCPPDHVHVPLRETDRVFTFAVDKYAETKNGIVKLSNLEL